jgi:predicted nucleic acid-binding protein
VILVDTTAWVEYDRATGSAIDTMLTGLIRNGSDDIAVTEPVLMEVLAGAADENGANQLRRLLTSFGWVRVDPVSDFEGAAKIYRSCRRAGITPRGVIDCMIANVAMRGGHQLLTSDRDFAAMATVVPLRLVPIAGTE